MNPARHQSLRFAILRSFAVSSWAFAYETISSSREWWVWAGYLGTWSGALVFKELASKWNGQLPWANRNDTQPRSEKEPGKRSLKLVAVVRRAADVSDIDFMVIEGLRTVERQKQLVAKGASKTMNSKHITGHAVDIARWLTVKSAGIGRCTISWPHHQKQSAKEMGVNITWGGDWKFMDGPHWEIDPVTYLSALLLNPASG